MSPSTIRKRIQYGWEEEGARTIPLLHRRYQIKHESLNNALISKRINKGWSYERATTTPKFTHGGRRVFSFLVTNGETKKNEGGQT